MVSLHQTRGGSIFIALLFVSVIKYCSAITCLRCENVGSLTECNKFVECASDEGCFLEKYLNQNTFQIVHRAGCRNIHECKLVDCNKDIYGTTAPTTVQTTVPTTKHARFKRDLVVCTECCYNDTCNTNGCGSSLYDVNESNLHCFQSDKVTTNETIQDVTRCQTNEICSYTYAIFAGTYGYKLGCTKRAMCELLLKLAQDQGKEVQTRCCDTPLCNTNPLSTNNDVAEILQQLACPTALVKTTTSTTIAPTTPVSKTSVGTVSRTQTRSTSVVTRAPTPPLTTSVHAPTPPKTVPATAQTSTAKTTTTLVKSTTASTQASSPSTSVSTSTITLPTASSTTTTTARSTTASSTTTTTLSTTVSTTTRPTTPSTTTTTAKTTTPSTTTTTAKPTTPSTITTTTRPTTPSTTTTTAKPTTPSPPTTTAKPTTPSTTTTTAKPTTPSSTTTTTTRPTTPSTTTTTTRPTTPSTTTTTTRPTTPSTTTTTAKPTTPSTTTTTAKPTTPSTTTTTTRPTTPSTTTTTAKPTTPLTTTTTTRPTTPSTTTTTAKPTTPSTTTTTAKPTTPSTTTTTAKPTTPSTTTTTAKLTSPSTSTTQPTTASTTIKTTASSTTVSPSTRPSTRPTAFTTVPNATLSPGTTTLKQIVTLPPTPTRCAICAGPPEACGLAFYEDDCLFPDNYCINHVTNLASGKKLIDRNASDQGLHCWPLVQQYLDTFTGSEIDVQILGQVWCGNVQTCYKDWYLGTSDDDKCRKLTQDTVLTYSFECTYCCTKDSCNVDLHPKADSLYSPKK